MSHNLPKTKLLLAGAVAAAATGCTIVDDSYDSVRADMNSTRSEIRRNEAIKPTSVEEVDDIWLGGESFRVSEVTQAPSLLKREVKIQQIEPISASDLIADLSRDLGIRIILTQDAIEYTEGIESDEDEDDDDDEDMATPMGAVNGAMVGGQLSATPAQNIKFTIDYAGSVAGLLDIIATKSGLFWKFEHGEITMRRYETKSYLVDITPGKVEFESTMKSDLSSIAGSGSEEGALSSSDSYHEVRAAVTPKSNWESMESAIHSMLSRGGKIAISEQVGTVTVTDTPQVQRRVAEYIKRLNAISSKQIAIKTEVLEISSDENGNFDTSIMGAFDWKGDMMLSVDGSQKLTFGVGSGGANRAMENKWSSDSTATLDLLRQNKNVSLVTSSMIYAMNGQPTPFQQLDEVGYLAETEVTEATTQDAAPSVSLKPGRTSQGFSMMMMPRIMSDGRVMMNFAVDSSRINGIDSYGIDGGAQIQLPNRSLNKYQQMVSVASGKPLMIAGLERTESHAQINSKFGRGSWMLGGSQKGGKRKVMTMIVLTPYVMAK